MPRGQDVVAPLQIPLLFEERAEDFRKSCSFSIFPSSKMRERERERAKEEGRRNGGSFVAQQQQRRRNTTPALCLERTGRRHSSTTTVVRLFPSRAIAREEISRLARVLQRLLVCPGGAWPASRPYY
ncbi:unnamed protein product [Ectocarpus fasciculatus]